MTATVLAPAPVHPQSAPDYSNIGRPVAGAPAGAAFGEPGAGSYDAFGSPVSADRPLRIWGDIGYEYLREDFDDGESQLYDRHQVGVGLNAATYLIEPWIALLRGGLRLTTTSLGDGPRSGDDQIVTGNLGLTVFPRSRFPFELYADHTDSRVDSGLGPGYDYQTTRYGAKQRYRSMDNGTRASISVDRVEQDGDQFGRTVQDMFEVEGAFVPRRHHEVRGLLSHTDTRALDRDLRNRYDTILLRHRYDSSREFWVDSSANLTHTLNEFAGSDIDTELAQVGSTAFWRPADSPWSLNGNWRLRALENKFPNGTTQQGLLTGSLGTAYQASRNLRWLGSVDAARVNFDGTVGERYRTMLGLAYTADIVNLGAWEYDRYVNLSGQHVWSDLGDAGFGGTAQLGHGLRRIYPAGTGSNYTLSFTQSISASGGEGLEGSTLLMHMASASWNQNLGDRSGFVRLLLADSRYVDQSDDVFQLVNLQANASLRVGRLSSWSGNATLQETRNRRDPDSPFGAGQVADTGWLNSVSADLTYRRWMLFGVRDLSFLSRIRARRQELAAAFSLYDDRERYSWENRLDYLIGRLETQLLLRIAELDETRRWLLMFRMIRRFGM